MLKTHATIIHGTLSTPQTLLRPASPAHAMAHSSYYSSLVSCWLLLRQQPLHASVLPSISCGSHIACSLSLASLAMHITLMIHIAPPGAGGQQCGVTKHCWQLLLRCSEPHSAVTAATCPSISSFASLAMRTTTYYPIIAGASCRTAVALHLTATRAVTALQSILLPRQQLPPTW